MSQPFRFSGAAIPIPPANTAGTTLDPSTGSLWNSQIAVEDTPQIFHSLGEIPAVPPLVTEDTGPLSKVQRGADMQGMDAGFNLGVVAPNSEQQWNYGDLYGIQQWAKQDHLRTVDPATGSYSPSMAPVQDDYTIYGSIGEIATCPAIVTLGSAFGDAPIDWSKLTHDVPLGAP